MTATLDRTINPSLTELSLHDRALILRSLGERWDSLIDNFASWDGTNPLLLEPFLSNMALPYVHESQRGEILATYLRLLADQLRALDDYRTLGTIPATLDEAEAYGNAPAEVLVALMDSDIDLSLFYLLHGPDTQPCAHCKRMKAHVADWNRADWPTSGFCAECRALR